MVEIVGPQLAISGAVMSDTILVDRLTHSLWCVPQPYDRGAMMRIARCLKALKHAIRRLRQDCPIKLEQQRYPCFMNHEIEWPPNASDNEKILPEHDLYWIEKTFS